MDFRGIDCPEPLIKVARELTKLSSGNTLVVLTDIPQCVEAIKDTIEGFAVGAVVINKKENYYELKIIIEK